MYDKETFNANEYNSFNEVKIIKSEQYVSFENISFKENITRKEENTTLNNEKQENPKKVVKEKKKVIDIIKDTISKITTSASTLVTTATVVVVASVVTVTTFLSSSPVVSNVILTPGNDYLMYSFDIDEADIEEEYLLEVSNPNYNYSVALELDDTSDTLSGLIEDLKPNYQYDFKLLKNNGEIGGYSSFYSETFYTLKAPAPTTETISNVVLTPNIDYLMYSFDITDANMETEYFIEVINADFDYSVKLSLDDTNDTLSGYIYDLTPDSQFAFKLYKNNKDIDDNVELYSEIFSTLIVLDPNAKFEVNYENNELSYETVIFDYYSVCSNTYIQYTINGDVADVINLDGDTYNDKFINDNNKNIIIEVYATINDINTLLGSYTYNFSYYEVEASDNVANITGNAGDKYTSYTDFTISYITYNRDDQIVNDINEELIVDDNNDLNFSFDYNNTEAYFEYTISCNDEIIYSSTNIELIPTYTFESYELTDLGLEVTIPEILSTDEVTIEYDSEIINVEIDNQKIIIPMNVPYDSYDITINGYEYSLEPGELYFIKNIDTYILNNSIYFLVDGFTSTVNNIQMALNCYIDETNIDTFVINKNESDVFVCNNISEFTSCSIECVLSSGDTIYGQEDINCEIKDDIGISFELGETDLHIYIASTNIYQTDFMFYDELNNITSTVNVEFTEAEGVVNWEECAYAKCKLSINGYDLYLNEKLSKVNSSVTNIRMSENSKYLYYDTTNLSADMSAYITDKNGTNIDGIIYDEYIEFYIYDDEGYVLREFLTYNLHLSNLYDVKEIPVTLNLELLISDIGLEYYDYGSNALIFTAAYLSESNYTLKVDAIVDGNVVNSETYNPDQLNQTIYALNGFNTDENMLKDTTFEIYLLDDNNSIIGEKYTYLVTSQMKTVTDYNFNTPNISDILVTYNGDKINLYIPTNFDKKDNLDLVSRIVLRSNDKKLIFESTDPVFVIEDIPNNSYGVTYQLVNKGTNINMLIVDVTVSGSVNEALYISPNIITEIIDGETYFWLDISNYINMTFDASRTGVYNHEECYFDTTTNRLRIKASSNEEITLFIYTGGNTVQTVYDQILETDPNIEITHELAQVQDVNITLPEVIEFTSDTTIIEKSETDIIIKNSLITNSDYIFMYKYESVTISVSDGEFVIPLYDENNVKYDFTEYILSINGNYYLFRM